MSIDLPRDYEAFKAEVIADQAGDDQGVYEVWWFANSRYPHLALSARLAIAESVVRELLQEGRVTLVRGPWPEPRHEREAVPLAEVDAVLRNWATWILPPGEPVVWMTDT